MLCAGCGRRSAPDIALCAVPDIALCDRCIRVRDERRREYAEEENMPEAADHYEAIIAVHEASRAVDILADDCRKKDAAIAALAADLDRLRVVWRTVAMRWEECADLPYAVVDAAIAAGLAEYDLACPPDGARQLTSAGQRLARGGA